MNPRQHIRARGPEVLNAICPYYTMFPLDLPARALASASSDAWVLDPFCGRGSTNYAARLRGLSTVGIDSNPVAVAISEGKLVDATIDEVVSECASILQLAGDVSVPRGEFWSLCYEPSTLRDLCRIRAELIRDSTSPARKALRALMMGVLHGPRNKGVPSYLSNQMPRTYASKPDYAVRFWNSRALEPVRVDVVSLVQRKASYYFDHQPPSVSFAIVCGDSRSFDLSSFGVQFSRVVTSPPYYGMRTYVPDQWLRYWFVGGPDSVAYRHSSQMSHGSADEFARQLGAVWSNVAMVCAPGAKIVVRFGGIHDRKANAKDIMMASIDEAGGRLRLQTVRTAGSSSMGKRQADQFSMALKKPIEEFDFYLTTPRAS